MPIHWEIDHDRRIVNVVTLGDVSREQVAAYMDGLSAAGAMHYGKLLDTSGGESRLPGLREMQNIGLTMREYAKGGSMGPLAIVIDQESRMQMALFANSAGRHRQIRLFEDRAEAIRWLATRP